MLSYRPVVFRLLTKHPIIILVYDEDADYELTIGGEVDVETGSEDEIKGTGAGQWTFYIEDDDGQLSTKDPNGTVIDVVKVDTRSV